MSRPPRQALEVLLYFLALMLAPIDSTADTLASVRTWVAAGPIPLVKVEPRYPRDAPSGWVAISFAISDSGIVEDAFVLSSEGTKQHQRSSLNALRNWKFAPREASEWMPGRSGCVVFVLGLPKSHDRTAISKACEDAHLPHPTPEAVEDSTQ